ncbi:tetratricopeptide repeat protein [Phytomonospora endophytica]|uniref:Tetratricopeptide repeat protein n=1 Tax=Phytomonospora endophytica TaxID=714109 RepID=A0A841FGL9_9ACTN|nr:tetratricopeptide repeat protein [Phytomonospora endophytica]MBB6032237.1 hypothetical protein [Phytomonospora endophytica]GIG68586.1 hypothetical protein Pen01_48810 [Phytomonospora endophytica]
MPAHNPAPATELQAAQAVNAEIAAGREPTPEDTEVFARLVGRLMRTDDYDDAFTWCTRELATLRQLLDNGRDVHSRYAKALGRHAALLNGFERHEESLQSSEQAVLLQQVLWRTDRDEALPLADSLLTRQTSLRELRRYDEALRVCHQAVTIHRGLDHRTRHPDPVRLTLAHRELARLLSLTGADYALKAFAYVVGRLEDHARHDPALRTELAETLNLQLVAMDSAGESPTTLLTRSERLLRLEEELADEAPGTRLTQLAQALHNHATQLSAVGRDRDAVEHSARAVAMYIRLTASERELPQHLAGYADTLDLHAGRLAALGRVEQALDFSTEALDAYDTLLDDDRGLTLAAAAAARENHACLLESLERFDEAAEHSTRAIVMLEELTADGYPRDRANLATALSNLANRLMFAERVPEAFTAAERALRIREDMAVGAAPERRADLGVSLLNLAKLLADHGDRGLGISYSSRSIAVLEELDDAAYLPLLAQARHNHAQYLAEIGRHEEAAACIGAAVSLREILGDADDLADSLHDAIRFHRDAGLRDQATAHAERREELLADDPERLPELVEDRLTLAELHTDAGHRRAAVAVARRAVEAASRHAVDASADPADEELLECALSGLARALRTVAPDEACEVAASCLWIAEERGDPYGLAHALDNYADALHHAGRHDEGLAHSTRALSLWQDLGDVADLASCHTVRAATLAALRRYSEALDAATRAVDLLRTTDSPGDLAQALHEQARRLHDTGRRAEAILAAQEALRHFETALPPHHPDLAAALLTAAHVDHPDAKSLAARAVTAYEAAEDVDPGLHTRALDEARRTLGRLR